MVSSENSSIGKINCVTSDDVAKTYGANKYGTGNYDSKTLGLATMANNVNGLMGIYIPALNQFTNGADLLDADNFWLNLCCAGRGGGERTYTAIA